MSNCAKRVASSIASSAARTGTVMFDLHPNENTDGGITIKLCVMLTRKMSYIRVVLGPLLASSNLRYNDPAKLATQLLYDILRLHLYRDIKRKNDIPSNSKKGKVVDSMNDAASTMTEHYLEVNCFSEENA